MLTDFLVNVAASVFTAGLFAVFAWTLWWHPKRSQQRFMGVRKATPSIRIYVSRLEIEAGGTRARKPIHRGAEGLAISHIEYRGALAIWNALGLSGPLQKLLARLLSGPEDLHAHSDIEIHPSPRNWTLTDDAQQVNLILLGSPIYNSGTEYYLSLPDKTICFAFDRDPEIPRRYLHVLLGRSAGWYSHEGDHGDTRPPDGTTPKRRSMDVGFVRRINIDQRSIFICAGLGLAATFASVRYLAESWSQIRRECQEREFGLFIRLENQDPNSEPTSTPVVDYAWIEPC